MKVDKFLWIVQPGEVKITYKWYLGRVYSMNVFHRKCGNKYLYSPREEDIFYEYSLWEVYNSIWVLFMGCWQFYMTIPLGKFTIKYDYLPLGSRLFKMNIIIRNLAILYMQTISPGKQTVRYEYAPRKFYIFFISIILWKLTNFYE